MQWLAFGITMRKVAFLEMARVDAAGEESVKPSRAKTPPKSDRMIFDGSTRCRSRQVMLGPGRTLLQTLFPVARDLGALIASAIRSGQPTGENLLLRKPLALHLDRHVAPSRVDDATRITLVAWSKSVGFSSVYTNKCSSGTRGRRTPTRRSIACPWTMP